MKCLDEPDWPFDTTPQSSQEIIKTIHKMKSSGSACPFNHVIVIALKRCPIVRLTLHCIIVYCWTKKVIPVTWKKGFCMLIYKKGTLKEPSNLRPLTLETVCAEVFTLLIQNRMHSFLINNSYVETNIQKGFWTRISGTIEHAETLTCMIKCSRCYQRNLVITLLNLKSTFGKLDHNLITSVLHYHHEPDHIRSLIGSFYTNYTIPVGTNDFITNPINFEKGVLQRDSLSLLIFNICFNTLIRTIENKKIKLMGYNYTKT